MNYKIIVDSCCDMTPELEERLGVTSIPMTVMLGSKEYIDDETLDLPKFLEDMKSCTEKVSSASPPPYAFKDAIETAIHSFVVTISSQLSGSYANAELGKALAEENGETDTHVFDTKSASAGEVLIAVKLRELLSNGLSRDQIIKSINTFIANMKTYFVLERYENLIKNGRLSKVTGKIVNILNFKMIMGSDGEGNIQLFAKPRGTNQMLEKIISFIKSSGRPTNGENMVICHCNNSHLAKQLSALVKQHFNFKEIFIVPVKGTIALYADDKGIVMAF